MDTVREKKQYGTPGKPVHTCVGVYPNGDYKVNYVADGGLAANVEYNAKMRPGRIYVVDGKYACGGIDPAPDRIKWAEDFVAGLALPDKDVPETPYQ